MLADNQQEQQSEPLLILCRDLLLSSKIVATAQAAGIRTKLLRDPQRLSEQTHARRLIVDLGEAGFLEAAVQWKQMTGGHVIGLVSHVDTRMIEQARAKGIDKILSRGAFAAIGNQKNSAHFFQDLQ